MNDIYIQGTTVIDLSQAIEPGIPVPAGFPTPQIEAYLSQERGDVANAELLTMSVHAGTPQPGQKQHEDTSRQPAQPVELPALAHQSAIQGQQARQAIPVVHCQSQHARRALTRLATEEHNAHE